MTWLPINLILSLLFMVSIIAIGIYIQVKLSRSENKYLGLILPVLSFLSAVLMVLAIYTFTAVSSFTTESVMVMDESGEVIEDSKEVIADARQINLNIEDMLSTGYVFLVSNIPTVILSGIYLSERNKITMKKSIEKMKIEDL